MLQALRTQFDRQRDAILNNLTTVQRAQKQRTKDYVTDLLDWSEYDEAMQKALAPYIYAVLVDAGADAMAVLGMAPSVYDPFTPALRKYQQTRSTKIAKDINDETEKQLRASIIEGINEGEGTYQIRARVESVMGIASTQRADLIAQTEVAKAQSFADIEAWSQSGVVEAKELYTAMDERVCRQCGPLHGTVIPLRDNFFNKGDTQTTTYTNRNGDERSVTFKYDYDDVFGPAIHPRCRCTLLPVRIR